MRTLCIGLCLFSIWACQNEPKPVVKAAPVPYPQATFLMETSMDSMETPRSKVSFAYGSMTQILDTTSGEFVLLDAEQKQEMKMPTTYIVAGKSFWAGLQTTIAIDSTATAYTIRRQYQDDTSPGGEPFEPLLTVPK